MTIGLFVTFLVWLFIVRRAPKRTVVGTVYDRAYSVDSTKNARS
jgi:hypothetical protein